MSSRRYRTMDPLEIQNRYSVEKHTFVRPQESPFKLEDYENFIRRLPQREQDLIEMYCRARKKQKEIASFFGVTQGAISHRITRAKQRLKFLRDMPKLTVDIREVLKDHISPFDIEVVEIMIETTCQSRTAEILNKRHRLKGEKQMTQVKVRHRFERARAKLVRLIPDHPYLEIVSKLADYISDNLYMMHEVILPHFNEGKRKKRVKYREIL